MYVDFVCMHLIIYVPYTCFAGTLCVCCVCMLYMHLNYGVIYILHLVIEFYVSMSAFSLVYHDFYENRIYILS